MNYYEEIKNKIVYEEIYRNIKHYSIERNKLNAYIEIGKLLYEANNVYGDEIIKEYSNRLSIELNKKYSVRYLFDIRRLYLFIKVHPAGAQLTIYYALINIRFWNERYQGIVSKDFLDKINTQEEINKTEKN